MDGKQLGPLGLIPDRSDPLVSDAAEAGFHVSAVMDLGLSPLAFECNEAWKPLLSRLGDRYGYCWEWVPDEGWEVVELMPWQSRYGIVVLTKVG